MNLTIAASKLMVRDATKRLTLAWTIAKPRQMPSAKLLISLKDGLIVVFSLREAQQFFDQPMQPGALVGIQSTPVRGSDLDDGKGPSLVDC